MDKKTIGMLLGVGLIGLLIWYLFFRKKADGKTIINIIPKKEEEKKSSSPTKTPAKTYTGGNTNPFPLKYGSSNSYVIKLQQALINAGFREVGKADGAWGANTQKALNNTGLGITQIADTYELEQKIKAIQAIASAEKQVATSGVSSGLSKQEAKYASASIYAGTGNYGQAMLSLLGWGF